MSVALLREVLRATRVVALVESVRLSTGPLGATRRMRAIGRAKNRREPLERALLRQAIRLVDRCWPTGANCYRRVLMEIALDGGATEEGVIMGIRASGEPGSGHAWLGSEQDDAAYDVVVST